MRARALRVRHCVWEAGGRVGGARLRPQLRLGGVGMQQLDEDVVALEVVVRHTLRMHERSGVEDLRVHVEVQRHGRHDRLWLLEPPLLERRRVPARPPVRPLRRMLPLRPVPT